MYVSLYPSSLSLSVCLFLSIPLSPSLSALCLSVFLCLSLFCFVCLFAGARCSSVVRAFAHGAMGCWIDPSWGEPIELFLVPASGMCYPVLWDGAYKRTLAVNRKEKPMCRQQVSFLIVLNHMYYV